MDGSIETWNAKGYGIIRGSDRKTYLAHFSQFSAYKRNKKMITMEIGQDVSFTPSGHAGNCKAEDIKYDERIPLRQFAYFQDYEEAIEDLATNFAVKEKWSSSSFNEGELAAAAKKRAIDDDWFAKEKESQAAKFGKTDDCKARQRVDKRISREIFRKKYDVLFSFFERTFERIKLEEKIIFSDNGAAFNTSLGNKFDKDIFAVFKKNKQPLTPYIFEKFTDGNFVSKNFSKVPEPPNYFIDIMTNENVPSDHLMLDYELPITPDDEHLFDARRSRFPDEWQNFDDDDCASRFEQLLVRSRSRIRRNFRAAVPFYYPALKKIQMLLPISFNLGEGKIETRALVVSREGAGYSAETIMPLEWAYKNARLVAKPDREDWLDF